MYKAFNKLGSIEIEGNQLKYRIATQEINIDDPQEVEKDIKRTLQVIENQDTFLLPYDIQTVNRYMVLYYDLAHYNGLEYLRELPLKEKLPYLLSLVEIAKSERKGIHVLWDRMNFVVDKYEKTIKVLLFETDHLKVYEKENNFKSVVDIMTYSMTILSKILGLPKRNDFIDPSEENIRFVETIFRLDNLDDLAMYIETLMIDLESQEDEVEEVEKKGFFKKDSKPKKKKTPVKKVRQQQPKKKKKAEDKNSKMMKLGSGFFVVTMLIYFLLPVILPAGDQAKETEQNIVDVEDLKVDSEAFEGSEKYNNNLVSVYRKAYNSDYKDAYEILAKIPKKELSSADVPLMIKVYNETSHLGLLMDEMPMLATDVITFLLTNEKMDTLPDIAKTMKTKNPYIEFEVAYMTEDFKTMLTYLDKIEINGRKEQQVIDAYLALGELDNAREFANKVGNPDLIKQVETFKN
ncbi:hypothetical protein HUN92_13460 [Bacillus firmus]|uniref:hypothetical protein n=1 Tax=Cytobacillus firmus TaxID=1399 RepID=UPI001580E7F5|nr:hypothetical protein [Cytobacillus firmus]NUH84727.1 hypothetical protein [Cytobacillus firmus]